MSIYEIYFWINNLVVARYLRSGQLSSNLHLIYYFIKKNYKYICVVFHLNSIPIFLNVLKFEYFLWRSIKWARVRPKSCWIFLVVMFTSYWIFFFSNLNLTSIRYQYLYLTKFLYNYYCFLSFKNIYKAK